MSVRFLVARVSDRNTLRPASSAGPRSFIRSLAQVMSHPDSGTGKRYCVARIVDGTLLPSGTCFEGGKPVRRSKKRAN